MQSAHRIQRQCCSSTAHRLVNRTNSIDHMSDLSTEAVRREAGNGGNRDNQHSRSYGIHNPLTFVVAILVTIPTLGKLPTISSVFVMCLDEAADDASCDLYQAVKRFLRVNYYRLYKTSYLPRVRARRQREVGKERVTPLTLIRKRD